MTRVPSLRRRERPRRLVAAAALLLVSTVTAVVALLVGTLGVLTVGVVVALLASWCAARLGHDVLVDERHRHAEERVVQARAFRSLYLDRSSEHALFAGHMRDRLLRSERHVAELRGMLRLAEGRLAELETRLARPHLELIDELAEWDAVPAVDSGTVVDLLAWEERATTARVVEQRRRAL